MTLRAAATTFAESEEGIAVTTLAGAYAVEQHPMKPR
jgi:hypothetical protein